MDLSVLFLSDQDIGYAGSDYDGLKFHNNNERNTLNSHLSPFTIVIHSNASHNTCIHDMTWKIVLYLDASCLVLYLLVR